MDDSDHLMTLAATGDPGAFGELFETHHRAVYNFARLMLGESEAAAEVMHDSFLAAMAAAPQYEPRGHFKAWLMSIARNRCLNRLAAEKRRRALIATLDFQLVDPPDRAPSPAAVAGRHDEHRRLRAAIAALPPPLREAIGLYAFEQLPYAEIAEITATPINTVKTHIRRAREQLRTTLDPNGDRS